MQEGETEEEYLDRIAAKHSPKNATRLPDVDQAKLPKDPRFMNCWRWNGAVVVEEQGLLFNERWRLVREQRDKLLEESDKYALRAQELALDSTELVRYRQALRDIPQAYSDPDRVVWPAEPRGAIWPG